MIATILEAREGKSKTGRQIVRMMIEVDNDIHFIYITPDAYATFWATCKWCRVPIVRKKGSISAINPERFKGKLIPVEPVKYQGRQLWQVNTRLVWNNVV